MNKSPSPIQSICVYCGSSPGTDPAFVEAARDLGELIAGAAITLVYGGGTSGIMGAVASSAIESGGHVTGIIPDFLQKWEQNFDRPEFAKVEMVIVPDMHTRKHMMFEKADAFIALPGGIGTLEELVEMMTWAQLRRHTKPMALLNTQDFWSPLINLIDHMTETGFLHNPELTELVIASEPEELISRLLNTER